MPEPNPSAGKERLPTPPRRGDLRLRHFAVAAAVAVAAALMAGFGAFLAQLPTSEIELREKADGIVVFTGGASRVSDAMELLALGLGRRLLISGVYPRNNSGEISRSLPEHNRLIECCVDLDRFATNTHGNAVETRRWVREQGFQSLIVVTSNYHMPRAIAELSQSMPDLRLIPFPVIGDRWRTDSAWASGVRARLLLSEYAKLVVAELRGKLAHFGISRDNAGTSSASGRMRPETALAK
jgi:uncharacterized SAM-binding protein YcdF (DUF218 family)